eukprot:c34578_g1_i1.p1 GENE.c34578_g1_i1~~c34578_g1_i1.p1  ORF type:complete len:126 (+),score=32.12 c34578_g1_i1:36-413(+)
MLRGVSQKRVLFVVGVRSLSCTIAIVGKQTAGEKWMREGCDQYVERMVAKCALSTRFLKNDEELEKTAEKHKGGAVFCLDELGKQLTSVEFKKLMFTSFQVDGPNALFVIGGADGLPGEAEWDST